MNGYATALGASSNSTIKDNYSDWIVALTQGGTSYPNVSAISNFETNYFSFLAEFNASDPNYGNGTVLTNLKPEALKAIFNSLVKENCGM